MLPFYPGADTKHALDGQDLPAWPKTIRKTRLEVQ